MSDREELRRLVDMPALVEFILSSDWLAKVKREAAAEAWWEGVNDQWKHRPIGNRVLETDNPHRKQVTE